MPETPGKPSADVKLMRGFEAEAAASFLAETKSSYEDEGETAEVGEASAVSPELVGDARCAGNRCQLTGRGDFMFSDRLPAFDSNFSGAKAANRSAR